MNTPDRLTPAEIEAWAAASARAQSAGGKVKAPDWWAINQFMGLGEQHQAEDAWLAILAVLTSKPSDAAIGILAAGPLEDLIQAWGPKFIDRIEVQARRDGAFRHLLGGVWRSGSEEIWQRIEVARVTALVAASRTKIAQGVTLLLRASTSLVGQAGGMEPLRLASLWSRALAGAKAIPVAVEVHLGKGLPQFQNVGSLLPQDAPRAWAGS